MVEGSHTENMAGQPMGNSQNGRQRILLCACAVAAQNVHGERGAHLENTWREGKGQIIGGYRLPYLSVQRLEAADD